MFAIKPLILLSLLWEPKSPGRAPLWNPLQDSRRFEGIDADFKELANTMHQTPNVVEATNKPGLFGKLEDIQSRWECHVCTLQVCCQGKSCVCFTVFTVHMHTCTDCVFLYRLSLCEKALAEYLDTKRLAFPRFYFISSADLLDILSNGTNPHQVDLLIFVWGKATYFMHKFVSRSRNKVEFISLCSTFYNLLFNSWSICWLLLTPAVSLLPIKGQCCS